jgi:hypothetical protein
MIVESNDEESSSQNESQRISVTLRNAVQSCRGMAETSLSTFSSSETREIMLVRGRLSSRCAISMGQLPIVKFRRWNSSTNLVVLGQSRISLGSEGPGEPSTKNFH